MNEDITLEFDTLMRDKGLWRSVIWEETGAEKESGVCPAREEALAKLGRDIFVRIPPGQRGLFQVVERRELRENGNDRVEREYVFFPLKKKVEEAA